MNRTILHLAVVLGVFVLISCNSCVETSSLKPRYNVINSGGVSVEEEEQILFKHIIDRTVLIKIQCASIDGQTMHYSGKFNDVGWGSGVIMASTPMYSLIQTAWHVVGSAKLVVKDGIPYDCRKLVIYRYNRYNKVRDVYRSEYSVVAVNKNIDSVVIKVYKDYGVSTMLANRPILGQAIRVVGFPYLRNTKGVSLSIGRGIVGSVGVRIGGKGIHVVFRISSSVYYGNSGGGVWSLDGKLVGIVDFMSGWNIFGIFIPQQNCSYGIGSNVLRTFYENEKLDVLLM